MRRPLVSVVIPTCGRPERVTDAVRSALAQTLAPHEIMVVVDGTPMNNTAIMTTAQVNDRAMTTSTGTPDGTPNGMVEATLNALRSIDDPRLNVVVAGRRLGNALARNLGIRRATGDWIALLDDDDLWMPDKLAIQFEALRAHGLENAPEAAELSNVEWLETERPVAKADTQAIMPVVSCRLRAVAGQRHFIWPRIAPRASESVARYLFCRRFPMSGDRLLQTSTLLAPRCLFDAVPFRPGRRFVDQDWLLRCDARCQLRLVFPRGRQALVEWDITPSRTRVSDYRNWRWGIVWARRRRTLLGGRAQAAFLMTLVSASAADAGCRDAFWVLLRRSFQAGIPNAAELATHIANFTLHRSRRDRLVRLAEQWLRRHAR